MSRLEPTNEASAMQKEISAIAEQGGGTTKVEQLIQQHCPNGVEYKKLGEVLSVNRGRRLTKVQLSEDGQYYVYHGSKDTPLGKYSQFNVKGNTTIVVNTGGIGGVKFCDDDFWCSDGSFWIGHSDLFNDKFVYYYLSPLEPYFASQKRVGGVPTIDRSVVENVEIPIPPLPVQEEIVRILDNFTELQAELQKRLQQYNYYRNQLLSFEDNNTRILQLQQCVSDDCSMSYGIVQPGDDYLGGIPVVRPVDLSKRIIHIQGIKTIKPELLNSYSRTKLKGGELLVCVRGTTGMVSFAGDDLRGGNVSRGIVPLRFNSLVDAHYMYHLFNSDYVRTQIGDKTRGAALQQINVGDLKKILIPVPPITEQKRIASILDRFDALTNDLSQGLPAEIEARRKQYEYYRDQLLTFKQK